MDNEVPAVLQDVLGLPEVRKREVALGLKQGYGQGGPAAIAKHPTPKKHVFIHLNLQNLSLQDVFNKIVQATPDAIWIYHESDCNGAKTYTVEVASGY